MAYREGLKLLLFSGFGGVLGLYLRFLYRKFGHTVSNREGLGGNFPLLVIATVLVIFVVKSSLALSLGLVGALSIVRFRAAIKEPEELIFLFFCIACGLALGAQLPELAVGAAVVFTLFLLVRNRLRHRGSSETLLLTISGPESALFDGDAAKLNRTIRDAIGDFTIQRLDLEDGQVQFRAVVNPDSQQRVIEMATALRERLPQCRVAYMNLANIL